MTEEHKSFFLEFLLYFIIPVIGYVLMIIIKNGLFALIIAPMGFLGMAIHCFKGKVFWKDWQSKSVRIIVGIGWILFAICMFFYILHLTKTGQFFPIRLK